MRTIQDFIDANKISMTAAQTDENPSMSDARNMDHWKCLLKRPGARMTVYFSMGYGHKGAAPNVPAVLDCLASDSCGADDSFESWAADRGYDTDSRKAEKTFKAVQKQAKKLRAFLGDSEFDALLYDTERG